MGAAMAVLRERLERLGRITFAEFMRLALYGEGGYYTRSDTRIGRDGGDFVTAPGVSPALGASLGRLYLRLQEQLRLGPGELGLIELGSGEGGLLAGLLGLLSHQGVALPPVTVVEPGRAQRARCSGLLAELGAPARCVASLEQLEDSVPASALVVANELFDALPVHRIRAGADGLEEAWVTLEGDRLVERWAEPSTPALDARLARLGVRLRKGQLAELCLEAPELLRRASRLLAAGAWVILDYGYPSALLYDPELARPTLRGFSQGRLLDVEQILAQPGSCDITAHVDFSSLAASGGEIGLETLCFCDQASLLVGLGAHELPAELRTGLARLLNLEEMGGTLKALVLGRGVDAALMFGVRDRSRLLWPPGSG